MTAKSDAKTDPNIDRLEALIFQFTKSASDLIESDHKKVDLMYDFFFVGKPDATPKPVPPFVNIMQTGLDDIAGFKKSVGRLAWIIVSLIVTGLFAFGFALYDHLIQVGTSISLK